MKKRDINTYWRKHGLKNTPEYELWCRIKKRCYNSKDIDFKYYGGIGICLYNMWVEDFKSFYNYIILLPDYKNVLIDGLTLDRIDVTGNYEPNNLRWANDRVQAANRHMFSNNTTGYIGIYYSKSKKTKNKWIARVAGYHIGNFYTKEEAIIARNEYIIEKDLMGYKIQEIQ